VDGTSPQAYLIESHTPTGSVQRPVVTVHRRIGEARDLNSPSRKRLLRIGGCYPPRIIMPKRHKRIDARLEAAVGSDPRINEQYVRLIEDESPPVVLVGVVHDHPASNHRVAALVEAVDPETVAVELPDFLVPVVDSEKHEGDGGEMAAAITAAGTTPAVGIDVAGRGTGGSLVAELREQSVGPSTILRTVRSACKITAQAVLARVAHAGVPGFATVADLESDHDYDLPADASPTVQADHERSHIERSTTLSRAFEPPAAAKLLDAVRERHMSKRLERLREDGPVVGVVGYGHLDSIEERLRQ